jgi:hypothetical protein
MFRKVQPNSYELASDQLPPGREQIISELEKALVNNQNIAIIGGMMSGKSTLMRYCAQASLAGHKGMVIDLSGVDTADSFRRRLINAASKISVDIDSINPDNPVTIYIDEFGYLAMFSEEEQIEILSYMMRLNTAGLVNWVVACNVPMTSINLPENDLFDVSLQLDPPQYLK